MKQRIHPDYHPVVFRDRVANFAFLTRSTATSERTITWEDGRYLSRRRRRDLVGKPPVLHRAGARPRHGRTGGAVPPPVRQQRQRRLTTSGSLHAPAITGRPILESGGPFPCPHRPIHTASRCWQPPASAPLRGSAPLRPADLIICRRRPARQ